MKAGTLILSFLFVVLTIQPAFIKWNNVSCAKELTTSKATSKAGCKKTAKKSCSLKAGKQELPQKQQTDDPCNTCNPFMVCNGCAYMPADMHPLFSPFRINVENTSGYYDTTLPSFESDSWHPPEMFMRL